MPPRSKVGNYLKWQRTTTRSQESDMADEQSEPRKPILILGRPNDPQSDADLRDFAEKFFAKLMSAAECQRMMMTRWRTAGPQRPNDAYGRHNSGSNAHGRVFALPRRIDLARPSDANAHRRETPRMWWTVFHSHRRLRTGLMGSTRLAAVMNAHHPQIIHCRTPAHPSFQQTSTN